MDLKRSARPHGRDLAINLLVTCAAVCAALVLLAPPLAWAGRESCQSAVEGLPSRAQDSVNKSARVLSKMPLNENFSLAEVDEAISKIEQPQMRAVIRRVNDRLKDKKAWAEYIEDLSREAFKRMLKSSNPVDRLFAERGRVNRRYVLAVLASRAEARGLEVGVVKTFSSEMRMALWKGPFLDPAVRKSLHGEDTHFVQLDFVAPVIEEQLGGDFRRFHRFLASRQGIGLWTWVFDLDAGAVPNNPDFIGPQLRRALPFK